MINNPPANAQDVGTAVSIPGSGRSPGGGHGNPLQYSCLESPMDRGAWWATVHSVTKNQTQLKQLSAHTQIQNLRHNEVVWLDQGHKQWVPKLGFEPQPYASWAPTLNHSGRMGDKVGSLRHPHLLSWSPSSWPEEPLPSAGERWVTCPTTGVNPLHPAVWHRHLLAFS